MQKPPMNVLFAETSFSFLNLKFRKVTKGYNKKHSNKIEPLQDVNIQRNEAL